MNDIENDIMNGILREKEKLSAYETLLEIPEKQLELLKQRPESDINTKQIKMREIIRDSYLEAIRQTKERIGRTT